METENWRPIPQWEVVYDVSDLGRVKRIAAANGKPGGIMRGMPITSGYLTVRLRYRGRADKPTIHSLVMAAFVGPRQPKMQINHKDGDKTNNRLDNLEYVTCSENHLHAFRILKRPSVSNKGEKAGRAKLTNEQVLQIRARFAAGGISQQSLANQYGVTQPMIGFIVRRESWTHI